MNVGNEEGLGASEDELLDLGEEAKGGGGGFDKRDCFQKRDGVCNVSTISVKIEGVRDQGEGLENSIKFNMLSGRIICGEGCDVVVNGNSSRQ